MIRLLVADCHDVVRAGLRKILESHAKFEVVAEASNGRDAVSKALQTKPDVAILDYALPLMNGAEVTRQIHTRLPRTEVLIFTMYGDENIIHDILFAGARGYLLKTDAMADLLTAIKSLALHKPFFTATIAQALLDTFLNHPGHAQSVITARERNVLQLIAEGHTSKQIAGVLNVSVKTVESHRAALKRKLKLSSSASLVRYAIRNKIAQA